MKEYFGKTATKYKQTKGKQYILFPTLSKYIPPAKSNDVNLLDIGCGNGDFYQIVKEKGYHYFGFDISNDMIGIARQNYPQGEFRVLEATDFAGTYSQKFNIIISSCLFPSLRSKKEITKSLTQSRKVLKNKGLILIGLPYPCFDGYMQFGLFGRKGVKAQFKGYFQSQAEFEIKHQLFGKKFVFADCHWTLSDYIDCIKNAQLSIEYIDECKPEPSLQKTDKEFYEERIRFPTYMVIVLK